MGQFVVQTVLFIAISLSSGWSMVLLTQEQHDSDVVSVNDGVYTVEQADRGKAQFEISCSSCHGQDLSGGYARALVGDRFIAEWKGTALDDVFERIRSMPPPAPSSLGDAYIDILAYILQGNGFIDGPSDLRPESLARIRFDEEEGVEVIPNFTLIQAIGCLARVADHQWALVHATEATRTRDPSPSSVDGRAELALKTLGINLFQLMNPYPSPEGYEGHKVEVKGFIIFDVDGNRINVTSLQSLSSACNE